MPLPPRDLGDLLAEDVRRLDADEVFAEALSAWTGVKNLGRRSPKREHIWHDPMNGSRALTRPWSPRPTRGSGGRRPRRRRSRPPRLPDASRRSERSRRGHHPPRRRACSRRRSPPASSPQLVDAQAVEGKRQPGADRRRDRHRLAARGAREPGRRGGRLAAGWTSGGATSGSSPATATSATRRRPARRCSTTSTSTRQRVFPMGWLGGADGDDADAAAARYAADARLAHASRGPRPGAPVRRADAGARARRVTSRRSSRSRRRRTSRSGRSSPCTTAPSRRPPGVSLTHLAIQSAATRSGSSQRAARRPTRARMALSGAGPLQVPAAGAVGRDRTLWLLDRPAAAALPPGLNRISSP